MVRKEMVLCGILLIVLSMGPFDTSLIEAATVESGFSFYTSLDSRTKSTVSRPFSKALVTYEVAIKGVDRPPVLFDWTGPDLNFVGSLPTPGGGGSDPFAEVVRVNYFETHDSLATETAPITYRDNPGNSLTATASYYRCAPVRTFR
jgi:hypothetical protein